MKVGHAWLMVGLAAFCVGGCEHARHTRMLVENTPPAVAEGFHREFPGLTTAHIDRVAVADGTTEYELKFRDARKKYHRKMFSADGKLLEDKSDVALPAAGAVPAGKGM